MAAASCAKAGPQPEAAATHKQTSVKPIPIVIIIIITITITITTTTTTIIILILIIIIIIIIIITVTAVITRVINVDVMTTYDSQKKASQGAVSSQPGDKEGPQGMPTLSGKSSRSLAMSMLLPTPSGPISTSGIGGRGAGTGSSTRLCGPDERLVNRRIGSGDSTSRSVSFCSEYGSGRTTSTWFLYRVGRP